MISLSPISGGCSLMVERTWQASELKVETAPSYNSPEQRAMNTAPSYNSPDQQAMNTAIARQKRQRDAGTLPIPTFWTRCSYCKDPQSINAIGYLVLCHNCGTLFAPKALPIDFNLSGQQYGSSNGGPPERTHHHGVQNQVKGSDAIGGMSVIRSPLDVDAQEKDCLPEESVPNPKATTDQLFRHGLQQMINAFLIRIQGASHDELGDLNLYGKIILQNAADLGLLDPGLGAFLENISQQAADLTACRSSAALSEAVCSSSTKTADVIHQEKLKALALLTAADEEVSTHMKQVGRAKAALAGAKESEEMAKRARVQAEKDLVLQKQQLKNKEASRDEAKHALEEKEKALANAKLKQSNTEKGMLQSVEELKSSEDRWRALCQEAPGVKNWVL